MLNAVRYNKLARLFWVQVGHMVDLETIVRICADTTRYSLHFKLWVRYKSGTQSLSKYGMLTLSCSTNLPFNKLYKKYVFTVVVSFLNKYTYGDGAIREGLCQTGMVNV